MNTGLAVDRHRPPLALLIDRDADTRQMYAEFLGQSCAIDEAVDGREALAKALSRHPDIIITETRLPGINGYELCRILRLDSQTRDIPIVVVTGDAFDLDLQRAKNAGADAVLTKPCVPEQLATEIRRLLRQAAQLRERAKGARAQLGAEVARSAASC